MGEITQYGKGGTTRHKCIEIAASKNYFDLINRDYYRENMRSVRTSEFISLLMEVVGGLGVAAVIWYGGKLIVDGVMTIGDFFSFLTAILLLYTPAKRLAKVLPRLISDE